MPSPQDYLGCIMNHRTLGLVRIKSIDDRLIELAPFGDDTPPRRMFTPTAIVGVVASSLLDAITDLHIDVLAFGGRLASGANP